MGNTRRNIRIPVIALLLLLGVTAAAAIVVQTSWFKTWLREYIVREANQYMNGQLSISHLEGNLFFGVKLENIGVSLDGSQVVAVQDLNLKYNVVELITKGLAVDEIRLNKPVLHIKREGDTWSIARLIKQQQQPQGPHHQGPGSRIAIGHIIVRDASIVIDGPVGPTGVNVPKRLDDVDADLSFKSESARYSIVIADGSFRTKGPAIGLKSASGGVTVNDDTIFVNKVALRTEETSISIDGSVHKYLTAPQFSLRVASDRLSLPEVARVVPSLAGIQLKPSFEISVTGPLDKLGVDVNVRSSSGQIAGAFVANATGSEQRVSGHLAVRHLDLAPFTKTPANKSDLSFDMKMDVKAADASRLDTLSGTASVTAPRVALAGYAAENVALTARLEGRRVALDARVAAYGAGADASGAVVIPKAKEPVAYDIKGAVRHLDAAKLPPSAAAPPVQSDVNVAFTARGSEPMSPGRARTVEATLRFDNSTVAGMYVEPGSTASVAVRGNAVSYTADASVIGVDLERVGRELTIPALANLRYESNINVYVSAQGSGTTLKEMDVTAIGALTDSMLLGGRIPQVSFAADVANDRAHVAADGDIAAFDPSVAGGPAVAKGNVNGTFDVDATIDGVSRGATIDDVTATVRATLSPSKIGDLRIEWANIDVDYSGQRGVVRDFEVAGRNLNVRAWGPIALDEEGQSDLTFHLDAPSLAEVGKLAGVPLEGIATIDGTLTGNRNELGATGTLIGDGIKYGADSSTSALTVTSKYNARMPELDYERTQVEAETNATFVSIGGQEINELTAKTSYADSQVAFDATAKQPKRTLTARGSLAIRPEAQQVQLQQLALDTQGLVWRLPPGAPATIDYSRDTVMVNDIVLESGNQRLSASGAFGSAGDSLTVNAENVDLSAVDALMLRPAQFTGRLTASAVLSGTQASPELKADFEIDAGGFRQFHYDTFQGSAEYRGTGVNVDARLQQNASQWLAAKGHLPTALFSAGAAASDERVDFTVDSSAIDLGVVQGFTTQLSNVSGTLEAHVTVGGTASDPQPSGAITVQNGVARVEPTGVAYSHIAGQVDLQPDRVHIDQITVLDGNSNALTIAGDLAVQQKHLGDVHVYVNADDFKILNNKIGDVRVGTQLEIAGDLTAPTISGDLRVNDGKLDLDQLLTAAAAPYATKETQYQTAQDGMTPAPSASSQKPVFDALAVDVGLSVPNNFVVKANNLQSPDGPIGLGALNVTLGSDLHATKQPGDAIRIRGAVNTVRGYYDFQGRRFDILRDGSVRFDGLEEIDPALDIRTQRIIQGVTALVNVRGTLTKPQIVLTSNPPLEQADILSLIIFNQPLNSVSEGQQISLASRAEAMAAGAVTSQLAQSIGHALNLDQFEINLAPENGSGPQVTLGQQMGQLYIKVQQGVGDQSLTNLILEYELSHWLRLRSNLVQGAPTEQSLFRRNESTGADLIFVFSY